ncbi:MAG: 30S ribosomal protein S20 [Candidatus Bipolaricaulaceae bacterium]
MPTTRAAERALRKSLVRRRRNELRKSAIRFWRKEVLRLVQDGDVEGARRAFAMFQKAVDKAAIRGAIHPNKAARLKARLHAKAFGG